ncbi:TniQ family protein [Streptomyces canus]|uniref:TniQ family protein n=1 Tax=Streptomyces canus TaxID=58343 RepID=UPI0036B67C16
MPLPALRELPRGLVPLPDESLPGLLLRLSYRLERTPFRIAFLCGLHKRYRIPHTHLLNLDDELSAQVSRRLRLSSEETKSLTLSSLADTYTPLATMASMPAGRRRAGPTSGANWAFNLSSRFCPQCLRGDGSPVQETLGGPWKLNWHLPTNLVCPVHHRLLKSKCPACGQSINGLMGARFSLIGSPGVADLHPVQCRNLLTSNGSRKYIRTCGAVLSEICGTEGEGLGVEDIKQLGALKQRLAQKLGGGSLDGQNEKYFQDLILSTIVIKLSWPLPASLLPSAALQEILRAYAEPISAHAAATRRATPDTVGRLVGPRNPPPQDVASCGALLLAAEALLGDRDAVPLRDRVQPLARVAYERAREYLKNLTPSMGVSPAMARATSQRNPPFPAGSTSRPSNVEKSFQLQNVPAFLPEHWYDTHFSDFPKQMSRTTRGTARQLRRATSLRLAEIISGQPWYRCTDELGIPRKAARGTIRHLG